MFQKLQCLIYLITIAQVLSMKNSLKPTILESASMGPIKSIYSFHNIQSHNLYSFSIQQYSVDILDEDGNVFYSRLHNEPENVTFAISSEADTIRCKSRSAAGWSEINELGILNSLSILSQSGRV